MWLIDARLEWHAGAPAVGSRLLGLGRLALLDAVGREGLQGRSLGAHKVQVRMEGHERVSVSIGEPGAEPQGSE